MAAGPCRRDARLSALERKIPNIMAQALAALLEARRGALSWPRHECSVLRKVAQTGVRVQDLQRSIRIGLPVSGEAQHAAAAQPIGNQLDERRLYQPAFVVPFLWPGVRKQNQDFVQGLRCNLVRQNFNCIVADDSDVRQLPLFEAQQQAAHARPVNLDAQIVALRVHPCLGNEVVTVTEADLESDGSAAAEGRIEIEGRWLEGDAVPRPEGVECALLCFRDPAASHHE
jgi:hypothetical protein